MLEVCRDRHVIVHHQPDAVDASKARGPTHPHRGDVTAGQNAAKPSSQRRRLLSAPAYRRGGSRSNDTMSGAKKDITASMSFALMALA
jgi:hypothetical protein